MTSSGRFCATPHAIDREREERDGDQIRTLGPKDRSPSGHRNDRALREHVAGDRPRLCSAYEPALRSTCSVGIAMLTMVRRGSS